MTCKRVLIALLCVFCSFSLFGAEPKSQNGVIQTLPRLAGAANLAARFLVGACDENGRFVYLLNSNPAVKIDKRKYNFLRHAGTIYSLNSYYDLFPDPAVKKTALAAAEYLKIKSLAPISDRDDLLAVWSIPELTGVSKLKCAKLGGAGLALVALTGVERMAPGSTPIEDLRRLGDFILFMQKVDGSFYSKFIPEKGGRDDSWESLYYPGEAALGLMCLYKLDPKAKWLKGAARTLAYLAEKRHGKMRVEGDHWALLATQAIMPFSDKIKKIISKEIMLVHARQICRRILSDKVDYPNDSPEYGCFDVLGGVCPTATRLEGLLAALSFFPESDKESRLILNKAIQSGIDFLLKVQINTGAFAGSFTKNSPTLIKLLPHLRKDRRFWRQSGEIRIDYPQHSLSAILAYICRSYPREAIEKLQKPLLMGSSVKKIKAQVTFCDNVDKEQFPDWLKALSKRLPWSHVAYQGKLDREIIEISLAKARSFLLNNQKKAGNFNYCYNFISKEFEKSDNQVRQAGALWGLSLFLKYKPDKRSILALEKAWNFFFSRTRKRNDNAPEAIVYYPGAETCETGTVALLALSLIEFLSAVDKEKIELTKEKKADLHQRLDSYLAFLLWMRMPNGHFSKSYSLIENKKSSDFSPYFDGEALLCLVKAAKYFKRTELLPVIEEISPILARYYSTEQWRNKLDSDQTKGFYQWSCMAYSEYVDARWKNHKLFVDYLYTVTWWMINVHRVLDRKRNTAYAFEGITSTQRIALSYARKDIADVLCRVIDRGLFKLTTWQVEGPLRLIDPWLAMNPTKDPLAMGGILNEKNNPWLRIDVTQHQAHALILALKYVYRK